MPEKYYVKKNAKGSKKIRVHDSATGKILRWDTVNDLHKPEYKFKIDEIYCIDKNGFKHILQ